MSLCILPQSCLLRILYFMDAKELNEMRVSCQYVNKLMRNHPNLIAKRKSIFSINVKTREERMNDDEETIFVDCFIEKKAEHQVRLQRVSFEEDPFLGVWKYTGPKESFSRSMRWSTEEENRFSHNIPAYKTFFEWMAKANRNSTIENLHIESAFTSETMRCYERLANEYGLRATHLYISPRNTTPPKDLVRFIAALKPTSLTHELGGFRATEEIFASTKLLEFMSSLKRFEAVRPHYFEIMLARQFYKFPPHFVVKGGIIVRPNSIIKAIRSWHAGELELEHIEDLILPMVFRDPVFLAAEINLPHYLPSSGFSHIVIPHSSVNYPLHLQLVNFGCASEVPRWRLYTTLPLEKDSFTTKSIARCVSLLLLLLFFCLWCNIHFHSFQLTSQTQNVSHPSL